MVLDPNSDYVRLGEPRDGQDAGAAERFASVADSVTVRSGASGPARIGVRFRELSPAQQAAACGSTRWWITAVRGTGRTGRRRAHPQRRGFRAGRVRGPEARARNLGVDRWGIWPGAEGGSLVAELEDPAGPRCLVVDLGSLATREEQTVTAGAVLARLWRKRATREPIAIVIDEAHNICPADPSDPLTGLATEDAIRIAGEGRKFGLYLIVVTQRLQKVHENVLSSATTSS